MNMRLSFSSASGSATSSRRHSSRLDVCRVQLTSARRAGAQWKGVARGGACFSTVSGVGSLAEKLVESLKVQQAEALLPMEVDVEGVADDPTIHNPLVRMQRLGTGWFGVVMEYEGVIVESLWEEHTKAWLQVAEEFGYPKPLMHLFRRIRGCRDELVVNRVFNWTKNPTTVKMLAERKAQIFEELVGRHPAMLHEVQPFLAMLKKFDIPVALVCPMPEKKVKEALKRHGLSDSFDAVVTAEDSGAPEVEYLYMFAASQIRRPPMRCIVVGESNTSVEAAHELGMKSVIPSGHKPVYDFVSADLVVRNLDQIAMLNLKKLFGQEHLVRPKFLEEAEENSIDGELGVQPDSSYDDVENGLYDPVGIVDEDWGFEDEEDEDELSMSSGRRQGVFL